MIGREVEFAKMEFTVGELRKLPEVHVGFLVGSSLAISEIHLLQKVSLLASNTRALPISSDILQEMAFAQVVTIDRNLASKVLEYMNMVGDYKKCCERRKDTSMNKFVTEALDVVSKLKEADEYKLAPWYRNKVTNHYLLNELTSLISDGHFGRDDTELSFYLNERDGNSSYILGEQVLIAKLSEKPGSPIDRMNKFDHWVLRAVKNLMKLHQHFCIQLFGIYLPGKKLKVCSITPEPHLVGQPRETCLPILWDFQHLERLGPGQARG